MSAGPRQWELPRPRPCVAKKLLEVVQKQDRENIKQELLQLEQELALAADKTSTNVTRTRELESPAVVHIPAE